MDLTSAPLPPLRADDHVRGAGTTVMYGSFACTRCAVEWLRRDDLVFRHFPVKAKHPRAPALAAAAEAAALQGAFWPFADSLMADQGRLEDPHLWARVERLGLDLDRFEADRRSEAVLARVKRDLHDGLRAGVTGTPALFKSAKSLDSPSSITEGS